MSEHIFNRRNPHLKKKEFIDDLLEWLRGRSKRKKRSAKKDGEANEGTVKETEPVAQEEIKENSDVQTPEDTVNESEENLLATGEFEHLDADPVQPEEEVSEEQLEHKPLPNTLVYRDDKTGVLVIETKSQDSAYAEITKRKLLVADTDQPFIWREPLKNGSFIDHHRKYNFAPAAQWYNRKIPYSPLIVKDLLTAAGEQYKPLADEVNKKQSFYNEEFAELVREAQKTLFKDPAEADGMYGSKTKDALQQWIIDDKGRKSHEQYLQMEEASKMALEGKPLKNGLREYQRDGERMIISDYLLAQLKLLINDNSMLVILFIDTFLQTGNPGHYFHLLTPAERNKLLRIYANRSFLLEREEKMVNAIIKYTPSEDTVNLMLELERDNKKLYNRLKHLVENYETRRDFYHHTERILGTVDKEAVKQVVDAAYTEQPDTAEKILMPVSTIAKSLSDNDLDSLVASMSDGQMMTLQWFQRKRILDRLLGDAYWTDLDAISVVRLIRNTPPKDRLVMKGWVLPPEKDAARIAFYDKLTDRMTGEARKEFYKVLEEFYPDAQNTRKQTVLEQEAGKGYGAISPSGKVIEIISEMTDKEVTGIGPEKREEYLKLCMHSSVTGLSEEEMDGIVRLIKLTPDSQKQHIGMTMLKGTYKPIIALMFTRFDQNGINKLKPVLKEFFKGDTRLVDSFRIHIQAKTPVTEEIGYLLSDEHLAMLSAQELLDLVSVVVNGKYTNGWDEELLIAIVRNAGPKGEEALKPQPWDPDYDEKLKIYNELVSSGRKQKFLEGLEKNNKSLWNEVLGDVQLENEEKIILEYHDLDPGKYDGLKAKLDMARNYRETEKLLAQMPESYMTKFSPEERIRYLDQVSLFVSDRNDQSEPAGVHDTAENILIRLINSTPDDQVIYIYNSIFAENGKRLEHVNYHTDFTEYELLQQTLANLVKRQAEYKPPVNAKRSVPGTDPDAPDQDGTNELQKIMEMFQAQQEQDKLKEEMTLAGAAHPNVIYYANPGLLKSGLELETSHNIKVEIVTKDGQPMIEVKSLIAGLPVSKKLFRPHELVGVQHRYGNPDKGIPENGVEFMSAIELIRLENQQTNEQIQETINVAALLISLIPGGAVLAGTIKGLQAAIVIADIVTSAAMIIESSYRNELKKTSEGRFLLALTEYLMYATITVSVQQLLASPAVAKYLRQALENIDGKIFPLKEDLLKALGKIDDGELEDILKKVEREEDLAKLGDELDRLGYNANAKAYALEMAGKRIKQLQKTQDAASAGKTSSQTAADGTTAGAGAADEPNVGTRKIVDGVEYIEDQGRYYKRGADGKMTAIPKAEYDKMVHNIVKKDVIDRLDDWLQWHELNSIEDLSDAAESYQQALKKLKKRFSQAFAEQLVPYGYAVNGDGTVLMAPQLFGPAMNEFRSVKQTLKDFVELARFINRGGDGIPLTDLLRDLMGYGIKCGLFKSEIAAIAFVRKNIVLKGKYGDLSAIYKEAKDAQKMQERALIHSLNDEEVHAITEYLTRHPTSKFSVEDLRQMMKDGKSYDPATSTFKTPEEEIDLAADYARLELKIKDPNKLWSKEMKRMLMKREEARLKGQKHRQAGKDLKDPEYRATMKEMGNYSETLSEMSADRYMEKLGAKRIYPPKGAESSNKGDLDRVYLWGDEIIVVESKGGVSPLKSRKVMHVEDYAGLRVEQGTRPYLEDILLEMINSGGEAEQIAKKIQAKLKNKKVRYWLFQQKFDDMGNFTTPIVSDFKI